MKNEFIKQNDLDHLNTCNYIICKYPQYINEALYRYSMNVRGLRDRVSYVAALLFVIKQNFDMRSIFALLTYLITIGRVKF
jgi:hypothetical protein